MFSIVADCPCVVKSMITSQRASGNGVNCVCMVGWTMQSSMSPKNKQNEKRKIRSISMYNVHCIIGMKNNWKTVKREINLIHNCEVKQSHELWIMNLISTHHSHKDETRLDNHEYCVRYIFSYTWLKTLFYFHFHQHWFSINFCNQIINNVD